MNKEKIIEEVLNQMNLGDDFEYRKSLSMLLSEQADRQIIFSIWNNISDEELLHFRAYFNQSAIVKPELSSDEVLMEFAQLYPRLLEKVYQSLANFLLKFIDNYKAV